MLDQAWLFCPCQLEVPEFKAGKQQCLFKIIQAINSKLEPLNLLWNRHWLSYLVVLWSILIRGVLKARHRKLLLLGSALQMKNEGPVVVAAGTLLGSFRNYSLEFLRILASQYFVMSQRSIIT
jgi:hypothetical protein